MSEPTSKQPDQNAEQPSAASDVRRFARRPGNGWKHIQGSAVWEHETGLRIHLLGMARLPDGQSVPWRFDDEYDAKRQQGYNTKRALMVWALSLLSPKRLALP